MVVCFILHCKDIGRRNYSHMLVLIYNNSFNTNPTMGHYCKIQMGVVDFAKVQGLVNPKGPRTLRLCMSEDLCKNYNVLPSIFCGSNEIRSNIPDKNSNLVLYYYLRVLGLSDFTSPWTFAKSTTPICILW